MKNTLVTQNTFWAKAKSLAWSHRSTIMSMFCVAFLLILTTSNSALAQATDADTLWNNFAGLVEKWVMRLGGVMIFIGLVLFGIGWQQNDAGQKTTGIGTAIAGGIVMGAAALAGTFFA